MTQSNRHQQNMHHSVYLQPLLDKHGKGEGITFEDLQLSWKSLEQHCRNCQHQHQGKGHDKGKEPSTTSAATTIKSPILFVSDQGKESIDRNPDRSTDQQPSENKQHCSSTVSLWPFKIVDIENI